MCPGQQLDRLGDRAVPGDLTVVGAVQAHDFGEHVRVTLVRLRAGGGMPFPIAGDRHRVDRMNLVAGREQGLHPHTAVGLDPDPHSPSYLCWIELGP